MKASPPLRILFAEDEKSFRSALTQFLTESGFLVHAVAAGEDAIAALGEREFDVIVLDYNLPGVSGLNVLQWMFEQKSDTPVIVLTGAGSEHVAAEAMKLGAYDYVVKDQVDMNHLSIIIDGVHERHLFRRDREGGGKNLRAREDIRSSIETFENAIISLSHVANNSLSLLSLNLQEYVRNFVAPYLTGEIQEHSQSVLDEIQKDVDVLNSTIKSMLNLATAMQNSLSADTTSPLKGGAIQNGSEAIMKEHKARMGQ